MNVTTDETFKDEVLNLLPDAIVWVLPIKGATDAIEDFLICYSNQKANTFIGSPKGTLTGLRIIQNAIPNKESCVTNFNNLLQVHTSHTEQVFSVNSSEAGRVEVTCTPFKGGVLSHVRDKSAQQQAEQKEEYTRHTLKSIVDHSPNGIVVYKAQRNQQGEIVDFVNLHYNTRSNELTGYTAQQRETLTFKQILQGLGAEQYFSNYVKVVETNTSYQREQYFPDQKRWLFTSMVKLNDGFLALLTDVTALKESQQALQKQSTYLTNIFNASLNAIVTMEAITNSNGAITDFLYKQVNNRFLQWLSVKEAAVINNTMLSVFPNTLQSGILDMYKGVIETGNATRMQVPYKDEKAEFWFDLSITKLDEKTVVGTFNDITESKKALEQMQQQKKLVDNILRYSSNGISVTEVIRSKEGTIVDGKIIIANEAAIQYTGIPADFYLTSTLRQIDPGLFDSPLYQMALNTLETNKPIFTQYYFEPADRWLELTVSKMDDNRLINVFTDITPTKEAQLRLEALVTELKQSNANLEEFAYAASHDLKEPIRKILIFSDRLKQELAPELNASQLNLFDRMENAAQRMRMLVDDLLAYSYVSKGVSENETVDLNQKLQQVLDDLELEISEKEAIITVHSLPVITGHRRQLQQLFQNLISNALKYSKEGIPPEIVIACKVVKGSDASPHVSLEHQNHTFYQITVSDNGIGFNQEDAERIFHVFTRLHGNNIYRGTGVGLSIARKVMDNHRGFIWAQSQLDKGTTFTMLFPKE